MWHLGCSLGASGWCPPDLEAVAQAAFALQQFIVQFITADFEKMPCEGVAKARECVLCSRSYCRMFSMTVR